LAKVVCDFCHDLRVLTEAKQPFFKHNKLIDEFRGVIDKDRLRELFEIFLLQRLFKILVEEIL